MNRIFIHSNKPLKERRRELRKGMTPQEKILWKHLRNKLLGVQFQRQHSIGPYITDFYCAKKKLIIEIDGLSHNRSESRLYDKDRTKYFEAQNMEVIRFWNHEIDADIEKVVSKIKALLPSL